MEIKYRLKTQVIAQFACILPLLYETKLQFTLIPWTAGVMVLNGLIKDKFALAKCLYFSEYIVILPLLLTLLVFFTIKWIKLAVVLAWQAELHSRHHTQWCPQSQLLAWQAELVALGPAQSDPHVRRAHQQAPAHGLSFSCTHVPLHSRHHTQWCRRSLLWLGAAVRCCRGIDIWRLGDTGHCVQY